MAMLFQKSLTTFGVLFQADLSFLETLSPCCQDSYGPLHLLPATCKKGHLISLTGSQP